MPMSGAGNYGANYRSIITDITERKFMEKEMSRMERLNLIGEMAAGIAHEIRNPLTTVRGFLQSFMRKKEFAQFDSRLNLMITELDRANSIITEYLSLARNKLLDQSLQNMNTIVQKLLPLLESDALLNEKWIVTKLAVDIPDLLLDAQEMRQLILNFVRNGLEAMLPGGQLTIGTYAEAEQVVLYIQDQGIGIPQEIEQKLGTPFVTTKENGTGLGLPICFSIANRHNAKIEVKTGDSGTTFMVKFPQP
ncbi:ATP-binding protein [Sporomusa ovata]|uniref:histidine kinase n=2 Tax=Sporomusa ovata TaxID=2378 RepID=A0A0U1L000_9FIRM|nr:ATP-binding protein [Sporomusa ovata]CQR73000.1 Sporulation kinase [Sporomusa ovata]